MPKELDRCVEQVKNQLMKKTPTLSDKDAKSRAFAICVAGFKKAGKSTEDVKKEIKIDEETGEIIVAENVKLIINEGSITSLED